jgi:hypothetical protein
VAAAAAAAATAAIAKAAAHDGAVAAAAGGVELPGSHVDPVVSGLDLESQAQKMHGAQRESR